MVQRRCCTVLCHVHACGVQVTENELRAADALGAERAEAVKRAMLHAWAGYRERAWGEDEVSSQCLSLLLQRQSVLAHHDVVSYPALCLCYNTPAFPHLLSLSALYSSSLICTLCWFWFR